MKGKFELGPNVHAKAKQPRDVAKNKMGLEQQFSGHLVSNQLLAHASACLALQSLRPRLPLLPDLVSNPLALKDAAHLVGG